MILEAFSSGPVETNVYLIGCPSTKKAAVIDAPLGACEWVSKAAQKHSLKVEKILLTHSHWDHIADVASLRKEWGAELCVHEEDALNVTTPGEDGLRLFFAIEGVKPDRCLKEGQKIEVGELKIEVIHTPGHTPGGICFYLPEEKALFSGDTLFMGTIGRLDLPTARPPLMWTSLKKLAHLPPDTRVFPGHGKETTIGKEEWISRAKELFD